MSLEGLLDQLVGAVERLTTMGWAPSQKAAEQSTADLQSIYNAVAHQVQEYPDKPSSSQRSLIFTLASSIWVMHSSLLLKKAGDLPRNATNAWHRLCNRVHLKR